MCEAFRHGTLKALEDTVSMLSRMHSKEDTYADLLKVTKKPFETLDAAPLWRRLEDCIETMHLERSLFTTEGFQASLWEFKQNLTTAESAALRRLTNMQHSRDSRDSRSHAAGALTLTAASIAISETARGVALLLMRHNDWNALATLYFLGSLFTREAFPDADTPAAAATVDDMQPRSPPESKSRDDSSGGSGSGGDSPRSSSCSANSTTAPGTHVTTATAVTACSSSTYIMDAAAEQRMPFLAYQQQLLAATHAWLLHYAEFVWEEIN